MRALALLIAVVAACSSKPAVHPEPVAPPAPVAPATPPSEPAKPAATPLAADTPETTVAGNTFVAPVGWTVEVRGQATLLAPPEPGNFIAIVDVQAEDADDAVALAWKAYKSDHTWPLLVASDAPDKDGWTKRRGYAYRTSPNEQRDVGAEARFAGGTWTVAIVDMGQAVGEKRGGQLAVIFSRLLPKGYERESFAGKTPAKLDAARIAQLTKFVETAEDQLSVPGVAFGLVQDGKVVYAGGVGVRAIGSPQKVDADTLFMIASNTKALTTLLLARLVDQKKLTWDTAVTSLLPSFALGDPETTKQVEVKHLICACTGMPRQDLEWLFEFAHGTAETTMAALGKMHPTSKFGEMFQYSNVLAAAAGYVAGHVMFPKLELGAAYDRAIQEQVLTPLGMTSTTFDYARALRGNHAMPHSQDIDGKPAKALMEMNYSAIPVRPAGAAWSNVKDMLHYVQMELAEGKLPDGKTYIAKEPLLARRAPQVAIGKDTTYGMGLMVNTHYGIPVVHHGGDLIGYHSDMMWLPEQGVGAVILTNGDPGSMIRDLFQRKLLEVLFDGKPEADNDLAAGAKEFKQGLEVERKLLTVPADPTEAGKLAAHYHNDGLGDLVVTHAGGRTYFDFGEFKSEVATQKNPDGTVSFVLIAPGILGFSGVVGTANGKRTIVARDAQHEYVFTEQ
jgi:CubicO group peptidase (beta-lactamase class C family)